MSLSATSGQGAVWWDRCIRPDDEIHGRGLNRVIDQVDMGQAKMRQRKGMRRGVLIADLV